MTKQPEIVESLSRPKWQPAALSLISHGILIAGLLLLLTRYTTSGSEPSERIGKIVLAQMHDSDTEYFETAEPVSASPDLNEPPQPVDTSPPALPATMIPRFELRGNLPVDVTMDSNQMAESSSSSVPGVKFELTKDDLEMIAADKRLVQSRQPAGPPTSISLFGSGTMSGRKFVFLIDRSNSMGDQGLGVLKRARMELSTAINKLEPHHSFQIVAYHDRTATIARRQLLPATSENKQLVPEFMGKLMAFGGTDHRGGIYVSLAFDPDVIVLMTDGGMPELHGGELKAIRKAAQPGTTIHTFQFGIGPKQMEPGFLSKLAEQNNGAFHYIDVQEWKTMETVLEQP